VISRDWANFGSSSWGSNLGEEVNVCLVVLAPLARKIVLVIDRLNWANWFARTAIHTLIRVDVKHAVTLVNTIDWTFVDASFVLDIYTWQRDYIGHVTNLLSGGVNIFLTNYRRRRELGDMNCQFSLNGSHKILLQKLVERRCGDVHDITSIKLLDGFVEFFF
jgi:hypothetical protein